MPRYTKPRRTWQYSSEFKIRAVKLSLLKDIQSKQVAEGLDIHPFMLSRWRKEYREGKLQGDGKRWIAMSKSKKIVPDREISENARLKRELAKLKRENDLLKKWQRYLAERHQNDLDLSKDTEHSV